jgi:glycosyltransferase involved in cell wall biosynthesis
MKIWLPVIRSGTGTDVFSIRLHNALQKRGIASSISWYWKYFELFPQLIPGRTPPPKTSVIHTNSWNGYAFYNSNIPLVVTEHLNVHDDAYSKYKSPLQAIYHKSLIRHYEKKSFKLARHVTCVSEYTRRSLAQSFNLGNIEVIPTWVDTGFFVPSPAKKEMAKPYKLLFCGNPIRRKGWDLVPEVMRGLGSDFVLYFTGDVSSLDRGSHPSNIVPLGRISSPERMLAIYHQHDALLFPSRLEGLSQAVLEAMACGLPVIGAESSSMPEVIQSGKNGVLCQQDDADAYVNAIQRLFSLPEELQQMSEHGRASVEDRFSEDKVVPRYIDMYRKLTA